jgi:hypothetical protein
MGEKINAGRNLVGKPEGKRRLVSLVVDGKVALKCVLQKHNWMNVTQVRNKQLVILRVFVCLLGTNSFISSRPNCGVILLAVVADHFADSV